MTDEQERRRRQVPSWWSTTVPAPARPPRRFGTKTIVLALAVVAVASLVGLRLVNSRFHTIHGALDVGTIQRDSGCRLAPMYQGIAEGTDVTITDVHGAVVARTNLGFGKEIGPYCEFLFAAKVPDRTLYRIGVDHQGAVTFSKAYLGFYGWHVGLALTNGRLTWI
jgi:hypothetical protein